MKPPDARTAQGVLYTDEYQFTMAQLYFRHGLHETPAQFDHFFRSYPNYGAHQAGYCVNAGLEWLLDWMQAACPCDEDIDALRGQRRSTGEPLFDEEFLAWLKGSGGFETLSLRAIPEGRVVHPSVPLTVVRGPLAWGQILETALLNRLNYHTLIATKACRIFETGRRRPLLDFGLRRAHDLGGNAGARAALIGGAGFTSNVGISEVLGFPPKGTHAHSMVEAFMAMGEGELGAFRAYAEAYPDDCTLLVDTVNTLESGIPNAIRVFEELRRKGHKPAGVRLDSGDLAYLAVRAARMLDDAGFPDVAIVLSNELDELVILQVIAQIEQEAPRYHVDADALIGRLMYGVGTRLITSQGQSALNGVYKLVAIRPHGEWLPCIKLSETPAKIITPGDKGAWRLYDRRGCATADLMSLPGEDPRDAEAIAMHHVVERDTARTLRREDLSEVEPLQVEVLREGRLVYDLPSIEEMRRRREADVARLDPGVRRIVNPHVYHVSLTPGLKELKERLIHEASAGVVGEAPAG